MAGRNSMIPNFDMEQFCFRYVYTYIKGKANYDDLDARLAVYLDSDGLGIPNVKNYYNIRMKKSLFKRELSPKNGGYDFDFTTRQFLESVFSAISADDAEENFNKYILIVKNDFKFDDITDQMAADKIINAIIESDDSVLFADEKRSQMIKNLLKSIYFSQEQIKVKGTNVDRRAVCIAWILLVSLFPNKLTNPRIIEMEKEGKFTDYSTCLDIFIPRSKTWSTYKNPPPDTNKSDENSENIEPYSYNNITISLVTMANTLCENASKDGRLFSLRNTKTEDLIDIPDLNHESTVNNGKENIKLRVLIDQMPQDGNNVLVTGKGGCGKTFALLHSASDILGDYIEKISHRNNNVLLNDDIIGIPVYIPLNSVLSNADSIEDHIFQSLADTAGINKETAERNIATWNDMMKDDRNCRLLLMCDGFNEVVSKEDQAKLIKEIHSLQNKKIYMFIITSRYDMSQTFSNTLGTINIAGFKSYAMNDLTDQVVITYAKDFLERKGKSPEEIKRIIKNELTERSKYPDDDGAEIKEQLGISDRKVKELYKKPMALVMFCGIHTSRFYENRTNDFFEQINTKGELLHNFLFCIKNVYNQDETLIYDRFLKYLGYRMNLDGVFTITVARFREYIDDFGNEYTGNDITYDKVINNSYVIDIIKKIQNRGGLYEISYNHQDYRDYFAASYIKEILLSANVAEINAKIGTNLKIPLEVLDILADILNEYKYISTPEDGTESCIQQILNDHGQQLAPYAVALLIEIAKTGRRRKNSYVPDLSAFKFNDLDLTQTRLNTVALFNKVTNSRAVFNNCKISKETLSPTGHAGAPQTIMLANDNRYIITCAKGGFCVFDMKTGFSVMPYDSKYISISSMAAIPNSNRFVTGDSYGRLDLWEYGDKGGKPYIALINFFDIRYFDENILASKYNDIQDIAIYNNSIVFCTRFGSVYMADFQIINAQIIADVNSFQNKIFRCCRLEVIDDDIYISYGNYVFKNDVDHHYKIIDSENTGEYIYDVGTVTVDDRSVLIINCRDKEIESETEPGKVRKYSEVYLLDLLNMENDGIISDLIIRKEQGTSTQSFNGWNKFSPSFDNGKIYLSTNVNDNETASGFHCFSFEADYETNDEGVIICTGSEECYGTKHIMSVECVMPFEYENRKYVATTSIDRSVEVLDASGVEYTLIYNIEGYTNGVTCIDVVDENTIYTSHYSGEVCKWSKKSSSKWKCSMITKPHSNKWVWVLKHAEWNGKKYIVAGSYDHNISITDPETGNYSIIEGCKGQIKTLEFISPDSIITSYDYKDENGNAIFIVRVFKNINFSDGTYRESVEYKSKAYIRCMCEFEDDIYIVLNFTKKSEVYRVSKSLLMNDDGSTDIFSEVFHTVCKKNLKTNDFSYMRTISATRLSDGRKIFVCGGDVDLIYAEVWIENGSKKIIDERPYDYGLAYDNEDGFSCSVFCHYNNELYLVLGSYDSNVYIFKIVINENDEIILSPIVSLYHLDKALEVKYLETNHKLYVSLLSGKVHSYHKKPNDNKVDEELLFEAATGMHMLNVNFKNCDTSDISDELKKTIQYYGII